MVTALYWIYSGVNKSSASKELGFQARLALGACFVSVETSGCNADLEKGGTSNHKLRTLGHLKPEVSQKLVIILSLYSNRKIHIECLFEHPSIPQYLLRSRSTNLDLETPSSNHRFDLENRRAMEAPEKVCEGGFCSLRMVVPWRLIIISWPRQNWTLKR